MSLATTPRTWVAGEVVTAAEMNTEVRDAITGIEAAWTAYTATWTATTTNPTLGNGTLNGRFSRKGKTLEVTIDVTLGSTTTIGSGQYLWALPITCNKAANFFAEGGGGFYDSSATSPIGGYSVVYFSTSAVTLRTTGAATVSAAAPAIPAVGDIISMGLTYETP